VIGQTSSFDAQSISAQARSWDLRAGRVMGSSLHVVDTVSQIAYFVRGTRGRSLSGLYIGGGLR